MITWEAINAAIFDLRVEMTPNSQNHKKKIWLPPNTAKFIYVSEDQKDNVTKTVPEIHLSTW